MLALKPGGRGDVTTSHKLWEFNNGPDVPTPVTDGTLSLRRQRRRASCTASTSRPAQRCTAPSGLKPGTYSASPVLADGRLYVTNEDGIASVFTAGPKFEILAENAMDDTR